MRINIPGRRPAYFMLVFAVAVISTALPAAARAATAGLSGNTLSVSEVGVAQANDIDVTLESDGLHVRDSAVGSVADGDGAGGCTASGSEVRCPAAAVSSIYVDAGRLGDNVTVAAPLNAVLLGGPGLDRLTGGAGNDLLDGGTSISEADTMIGGDGFDTVDYSARGSNVTVSPGGGGDDGRAGEGDDVDASIEGILGGAGDDTLTGTGEANLLVGGRGSDQLDGRGADDVLDGGAQADALEGGSGNDSLRGGDGSDAYSDVAGTDTVDYSDHASAVSVLLDREPNDGSSRENENVPDEIENAIGGAGADTFVGNDSPNRFDGGPGGDSFDGGDTIDHTGGGSPDCVDYSTRNAGVTVTLDGAANDGNAVDGQSDSVLPSVDCVLGTDFGDSLTGGNAIGNTDTLGQNRLYGRGGDDLLDGGTGADLLVGGAGTDTVSYASRTRTVSVALNDRADDGELEIGHQGDADYVAPEGDRVDADVEIVLGGTGDDVLVGDAGANELHGGQGADRLIGSGGDDRLYGEGGDDGYFSGGPGADLIDGGTGDDQLESDDGPDRLVGGEGDDAIDYSERKTTVHISQNGIADDGATNEGDDVAADIETLIGGSAADRLAGGSGDQRLFGNAGDDHLGGGEGKDTFTGGDGLDVVDYSDHTGSVTAVLGGTSANGAPGENDTIASDVEALSGGPGSDELAAGPRSALIDGGEGGDTIAGSPMQDQLRGGPGNDTIAGGDGADSAQGGSGNDRLDGGAGNDSLSGDAGNDNFEGGPGADVFSGGSGGGDTADYGSRTVPVNVTIDGAPDDGQAGEADNVRTDVENLIGGSAGDSITGSPSINSIAGNGGDDRIDVRDQVGDSVSCDGGRDHVNADGLDRTTGDCESVAIASTTRAAVAGKSARLSRTGTLSLRVQCQGSTTCRGTLTLSRKGRRVGRQSFEIGAGKTAVVRIALERKARRLVRRRGKLELQATLAVAGTKNLTTKLAVKAAKG